MEEETEQTLEALKKFSEKLMKWAAIMVIGSMILATCSCITIIKIHKNTQQCTKK